MTPFHPLTAFFTPIRPILLSPTIKSPRPALSQSLQHSPPITDIPNLNPQSFIRATLLQLEFKKKLPQMSNVKKVIREDVHNPNGTFHTYVERFSPRS